MKDDPYFVTNTPKYLVETLWVICLFIYFYFTINVHMHESYVYAETKYLNYYGMIWSLKNDPMFKKNQIIVDNNELLRKIDNLSAIKYEKTRAANFRHFYNPLLDKNSEFHHEENWFDLGPLGKSWVMNLDLYEKI